MSKEPIKEVRVKSKLRNGHWVIEPDRCSLAELRKRGYLRGDDEVSRLFVEVLERMPPNEIANASTVMVCLLLAEAMGTGFDLGSTLRQLLAELSDPAVVPSQAMLRAVLIGTRELSKGGVRDERYDLLQDIISVTQFVEDTQSTTLARGRTKGNATRSKTADALRKKAIDLQAEGMTDQEIAKELKRNVKTVARYLKPKKIHRIIR